MKDYIVRTIEQQTKAHLFQHKIIIIHGARQVGKTTFVNRLLQNYPNLPQRYINCDEGDYLRLLNEADTSTQLRQVIGQTEIVVLDEAQRIKDIGLKLKLLVDTFPNQQIIATGSSSFELSQAVIEPLTGRTIEFWLYPLSLKELVAHQNLIETQRNLEGLLIFGNYPEVVASTSWQDKQLTLTSIATNYLYKDILKFHGLKGSETIQKLLTALALQIGQEVAYTELANLVGISKETVANYLDILEQAYIIFKLRPFSRNLRKELTKLHKIYFWDLGIRNSLINNFNPLSLRTDVGHLWENFLISEKLKTQTMTTSRVPAYFWRTYDQQEIDLVIEQQGQLSGFEIKWQKPRKSAPKAWRDGYPHAHWQAVTRQNYPKFLDLPDN